MIEQEVADLWKRKAVVINFGVPRSGTTLMAELLLQGRGYLSQKLPESCGLHPINSADGLLNLAKAFYNKRVIFIRTTRHPVDTIESELYIKPKMTPDEMRRLLLQYTFEHFNFRYQETIVREISQEYENVAMLTVAYDQLAEDEIRNYLFSFLGELLEHEEENRWKWRSYLEDVWMKKEKAAQRGKLSDGVTERLIPLEWIEEICKTMHTIIEAEHLMSRLVK